MFNSKKYDLQVDSDSSETGDLLLGDGSNQPLFRKDYSTRFLSTLWSARYLHGGLILIYSTVYFILILVLFMPGCHDDCNQSLPRMKLSHANNPYLLRAPVEESDNIVL
jgi:hypothetical protein